MNQHRLSSVALTRFYLRRIAALNPELHAVITVSRTALADARAADRARSRGAHGALLGIPIIVKDNVDTTGMPTTAGRLHRDEDAQGGRAHHRQGEPQRVGELPVVPVVERLERDRRPDPDAVRARP
jgi:hypothetical protein